MRGDVRRWAAEVTEKATRLRRQGILIVPGGHDPPSAAVRWEIPVDRDLRARWESKSAAKLRPIEIGSELIFPATAEEEEGGHTDEHGGPGGGLGNGGCGTEDIDGGEIAERSVGEPALLAQASECERSGESPGTPSFPPSPPRPPCEPSLDPSWPRSSFFPLFYE